MNLPEHDPYTSQDYFDALEDVHTRFILNLPESELQSADRIFFQLEQAWWFYQDFVVDGNPDLNLPSFSSLKPFALQLFHYSQLLPDGDKFPSMWNQFSKYKQKISNYGCILLSKDYRKIVLCRAWNGKACTFPAGKINQGERGVDAAARECYEETGFDPHCQFGLTATFDNVSWSTPLKEEDALHFQEDYGKRRTCYVCHGVPLDFPFEPVARKEVSNVQFYDLDDIPKHTYAVLPFLPQLRKWIKRKTGSKKSNKKSRERAGTSRRKGARDTSRKGSRGRAASDVVETGLASAGDAPGWSEEDMFATNARLLGRPIEYDGNPHLFEQGFGGQDPHAFHVVQGGFLNAGAQPLAPAPKQSQLQPLYQTTTIDDELQPFFGTTGETPFGDRGAVATSSTEKKKKSKGYKKKMKEAPIVHPSNDDSVFLTDLEITTRSQERHSSINMDWEQQYERDMEFVRQWAARLPRPPPSKMFGDFRLDADAILAAAGLSDFA